jgi:hypothetical protein
MRLLTFYLTRADGDHTDDDTFVFNSVPNMPDMVKVTAKYAATGTRENADFSRSFVLSRSSAAEYALSLVGTLVQDDDPFEKLQVSSAIFPCVIYRVKTLNEWEVRTAIQDIVYSTFNTSIE